MEIDPTTLRRGEIYQQMIRLVTPRPIAWVSTVSAEGVANLAPYSYFNAVGSNPPTLMFCPANQRDGRPKNTLANIEANGEFVVNIVSHDVVEAMNCTSADYESDVSEFAQCGLTPLPSAVVQPPRVAEARAHIECTLHTLLRLGTGPGGANLVIGRIVRMHLDEAILDAEGRADPAMLDTVGRMGGATYVRTRDRFDLNRPDSP